MEDENLRVAYAFCRSLVRSGNLPAAKFRSMIRRADKKQIWCYVDIPLWVVPYILLTLENFTQAAIATPKKKSKGYEFHFVFEKPANTTASALWNQRLATSLKKVFEGGKAIIASDNPFPLSQEQMITKAGDASWITDGFLQELRKTA